MTVCHIKDGKRQGVVENRRSTLKTDAMVAQIVLGLTGIPRKNIPQRLTSTVRHNGFFPAPLAPNMKYPECANTVLDRFCLL